MAYKNKADAIKYNNEFIAKSYDRIALTLPKGYKDKIRNVVGNSKGGVNGFIRAAIDEKLQQTETSKNE